MDFNKNLEQFKKMMSMENFDLSKFSSINQDAMGSFKRLGEITSERMEQLLRLNSEIATEAMENGLEMMKGIAQPGRPDEIISKNMEMLSELNRRTVENAQKYVDFCVDCQSEMSELLKNEGTAQTKK